MSHFANDIKYSLRMLAKSPGFTVLVVLTLSLGIAVNAVIFSFLDRMLLRPLPVNKPGELVTLECQYQWRHEDGSLGGTDTDAGFAYPLYVGYRDQSEVFAGLTASTLYGRWADRSDLRVDDSVEKAMRMAVSSNYFTVLGVKPVIGRVFLPEEEAKHAANSVAVISHTFWRQRFICDPNILGKTIYLNSYALTIIGVLPPKFTGTIPGINPEVYIPLGALAQMSDFSLEDRNHDCFHLLGRLKRGVSRVQAQANLQVLAAQLHEVEPDGTYPNILILDGCRGTDSMSNEGGFGWFVALFQTPTLLLLLVACANVANILLARGMMRQKEIAIRRAMGANRGDVIRQLLVESSLLALLSGACGALMAHGLAIAIPVVLPMFQEVNMVVGVDLRILLFTLVASLGSVFVFGLAPALHVSRPNMMSMLKEGSAAVTVFTRRWNLRNLLVVIQVAFSVIVLALGVLCVQSLRALRVADPGFDADTVLAVSVNLERGSSSPVDVRRLFVDLKERASSLPGVRAVCLSPGVPLSNIGGGRNKTSAKHVENYQRPVDQDTISWTFETIGPGTFQALGVPILRGREFSPQDGAGVSKVMIVNELVAQRYWPGQDPIGKLVTFSSGEVREVIGVVKAVKFHSMQERPELLSFWPLTQEDKEEAKLALLVRSQGDSLPIASFLQGELESAGLRPGTYNVSTLAERASELRYPQSVITAILNGIGIVGLLFVATGIAGVMAYEVSQRTQEIGIRMALGAKWQDVLGLVLRRGALLTGIGLGLGLGLSCIPIWIVSRLVPDIYMEVEEFLGGVHLWDPLTYLCVVLVVSLIMLMACWFPARRAAKIDPMEALRYE